MALDFPNSPSDGQYYEGFTWDATYSVWRVRAGFEGRAGIASTSGAAGTATTGEAYIFTGSGAITVSKAGLLDVLIIGGGGGGYGGGGGAGGYWEKTLWFEAGSHTVTIGAGGAAGYTETTGATGPRDGFNGGSSLLGQYVSPGGGGGATIRSNATSSNNYQSGAGRTGGSAGGGGNTNGTAPANSAGIAIPGFGNNGGKGGFLTGGGGGGAGQVGEDAAADYPNGSEGGNGSISTIISSTDATSFSVGQVSGSDVYYSGGGGGSPYSSGSAGVGGLGGGGDSNTSGTANTGGGGGTTGGSGVVIVRAS